MAEASCQDYFQDQEQKRLAGLSWGPAAETPFLTLSFLVLACLTPDPLAHTVTPPGCPQKQSSMVLAFHRQVPWSPRPTAEPSAYKPQFHHSPAV